MAKKNDMTLSVKLLGCVQFLGAFNANAFKVMVMLLGVSMLGAQGSTAFVSIAGALYVAAFILFSPLAGYCADRFAKRNVMLVSKMLEIIVMAVGLAALATNNIVFICVVLFLVAMQGAVYSPAQYGALAEIAGEEKLSLANGLLQMAAFTAVIIGTALGGKVLEVVAPHYWQAGILFIAIAVVELFILLGVQKNQASITRAAKGGVWNILRAIRQDKPLFLTLCAIAYFWFLGAVFQMNILLYAKNILHVADSATGILLAAVALGIAAGGMLAGRLSDERIEFGLVPLGALGLTIFCMILGGRPMGYWLTTGVLFCMGGAAGFYTLPLNAFFQQKSPNEKRGEYLGVLNTVNAFATLIGSLFIWVSGVKLGLNSAQIFFFLGLLSIAVTLYILKVLPLAFVRFLNWLATHTIYRLKIEGAHNVPKEGGALLLCNHVSYIDALIVSASLKRPIRFIMYRQIYNLPIINTICKIMKAIPIDYQDGPKGIVRSLQAARAAVDEGDVVCIFPEGGLTRTGNLLPFNRGFEKIMDGLDKPIVPMYMDNIWGSIFSFHEGRYFWKFPKNSIYPMTVVFGKALPSDVKTSTARAAVEELGAQACKSRGIYRKKLHIALIDTVKNNPFKFCMADSTGIKFNYTQMLAAVLVMKKKLFPPTRKVLESNEMIGVLLPASCMGSVVNGAILMAGKIPVNLNFTLSSQVVDSCIKQCRMTMIVTSRKFLEKSGIQEREGMIYLEDIKEEVSGLDRLTAFLTCLLPRQLIGVLCADGDKVNVDDTATVIFSSGSTGEPKGVMLTHGNIFSNIEGFYQIFNVKRSDVVLGALPFFHSFGFTATMCFPLGAGISVVYHNNPMDAAMIGKLAEQYKATMLVGTPTFLGAYLRRCTKEQFATLRIALVGAEKLKKPLADAFCEKYGIVPLEGYGATELSPIVSVGYPDYISEDKGIRQTGHKAGKVGHPIPGVAAKVVHPDTGEIMPVDMEGLLLIKGPNVMKGYLNNPQKTDEVIKDGWYVTGDIATIDNEGFINITDRLSRFSKIGGEMVPHIKIEEKLLEIMGATDPICAVTAVKDEAKGERLVVLYTGDLDIEWAVKSLSEKGLPNLWIPKRDSFYSVEKIPVLGTGKIDLKAIKALAESLAGDK
jgi:acyl-[acyl-carrier-protein]-phospholipid O-acyltransferase/long-chain-fatty-acid--[acyl-carrier-protein] ligase